MSKKHSIKECDYYPFKKGKKKGKLESNLEGPLWSRSVLEESISPNNREKWSNYTTHQPPFPEKVLPLRRARARKDSQVNEKDVL